MVVELGVALDVLVGDARARACSSSRSASSSTSLDLHHLEKLKEDAVDGVLRPAARHSARSAAVAARARAAHRARGAEINVGVQPRCTLRRRRVR
ncbi:MAG: hypothetical protein MZV49_10630 [Rhodopseudomonas palustris]|nr:hypothetical protein [Rhodopseudomonas palustris]